MNMINLMAPLLLLVAAGYLAHHLLQVEAKPLAKITLYILSPALIFHSLLHSQLAGNQLLQLAIGTLLLIIILSIVVSASSRILQLSPQLESALQLGSVYMNVGNYGLPVIMSVYGPVGLERAAIIVVVHQALMFSVAVYFAARSHLHAQQALQKVLKMPSAYAALLALVLRRWALAPPAWLLKPVGLLAQASVPIFLLLLGIQLAEMFFVPRWSLLLGASLIKLGLAPYLAYYLSIWLHLDPLSRNTLVLAAASPTAIVTTMLAVEFDAQPDLVSSLTLVTTMASTFTLPYILHCLK